MQGKKSLCEQSPDWAQQTVRALQTHAKFFFSFPLEALAGEWMNINAPQNASLGTSVVPLQACAFHRSLFWQTSSFHSALKFFMSTVSREPCPAELLSEPMLFTLCRLASSEEMLFRLKGSSTWMVSPRPDEKLVCQIRPHCHTWHSSKWNELKVDFFFICCSPCPIYVWQS